MHNITKRDFGFLTYLPDNEIGITIAVKENRDDNLTAQIMHTGITELLRLCTLTKC